MPTITYIDHHGVRRTIEAKSGETVMETAVKNSVPGIEADCGGACACATCHVYIDANFLDKVGRPAETERSMLDFVQNPQANSRLGCQITISDALEGLIVTTPESQY